MGTLRIVFLADSHLGFDQPARPRVNRPRRGDDFLSNYKAVLNHALSTNCDAVIHGGDVFHRSRVRPEVVQSAFVPLKEVARAGIPVFVVPGNHERSKIPHAMLASYPGIHIFDRPRTYHVSLRGMNLALSGFPFVRSVRQHFRSLLRQTNWSDTPADIRLLCVHHAFEGATVGPANFVFRTTDDVVRHADIPRNFLAVLSGHIHRHQVLRKDLRNRPLSTPILYPGSIERTSFAEREEPKGFLELIFDEQTRSRGVFDWHFRPLPARPMITASIPARWGSDGLNRIAHIVAKTPSNAIIRLVVEGEPSGTKGLPSAAQLRSMAGPSRIPELRFARPRNMDPSTGVTNKGARHLSV